MNIKPSEGRYRFGNLVLSHEFQKIEDDALPYHHQQDFLILDLPIMIPYCTMLIEPKAVWLAGSIYVRQIEDRQFYHS